MADIHMMLTGAGWLYIDGFYANKYGKFYRSCGNCSQQFQRHVNITNLVGIQGVVCKFPPNLRSELSIKCTNKGRFDSGREPKLRRYG